MHGHTITFGRSQGNIYVLLINLRQTIALKRSRHRTIGLFSSRIILYFFNFYFFSFNFFLYIHRDHFIILNQINILFCFYVSHFGYKRYQRRKKIIFFLTKIKCIGFAVILIILFTREKPSQGNAIAWKIGYLKS